MSTPAIAAPKILSRFPITIPPKPSILFFAGACRPSSIAFDGFSFSTARPLNGAGHAHLDIVAVALLPGDRHLGARTGYFRRKHLAVLELQHKLGTTVPFRDRAFVSCPRLLL